MDRSSPGPLWAADPRPRTRGRALDRTERMRLHLGGRGCARSYETFLGAGAVAGARRSLSLNEATRKDLTRVSSRSVISGASPAPSGRFDLENDQSGRAVGHLEEMAGS